MLKLSSDNLFYKGFVGLIIGPILIAIFIRVFWVNNFSNTAVIVAYILLVLFVIVQWSKALKRRKIWYDRDNLIIGSYFNKRSIEVPIADVISIIKSSAFYQKGNNITYTITFQYENKIRKVSFFKSYDLYDIEDMESLIELKKQDRLQQ